MRTVVEHGELVASLVNNLQLLGSQNRTGLVQGLGLGQVTAHTHERDAQGLSSVVRGQGDVTTVEVTVANASGSADLDGNLCGRTSRNGYRGAIGGNGGAVGGATGGLGGLTSGGDGVHVTKLVGHSLRTRVGQGDLVGLFTGNLLAQVQARNARQNLGGSSAVDVDQTGTLAGGGLKQSLVAVALAPQTRRTGGLQTCAHALTGAGVLGVLELRVCLQDQGSCTSSVGGSHGGTGNGVERTAVVKRPGGPDQTTGGGYIRLHFQLAVQTPRGEVRNQTTGADRAVAEGIAEGDSGVSLEGCTQSVTVSLGDGNSGDLYRVGRVGQVHADGAGLVVVDDYTDGASLLSVSGLGTEGAATTADKHVLALESISVAGGGAQLAVFRVGLTGGNYRVSNVGASEVATVATDVVEELVVYAASGEVVVGFDGVVHTGDSDGLGGSTRSTQGPQTVGAVVTLSDSHNHTSVNHGLYGLGGGVVGQNHVGSTQRHVDYVHAVLGGLLHGSDDDVGAGLAVAAKHTVGTQGSLRGYTANLGAGTSGAATGSNTGNVGTVTATVIRNRVRLGVVGAVRAVVVTNVVVTSDDARVREAYSAVSLGAVALFTGGAGTRNAGTTEFTVVNVNTGVDDTDLDALTGQAKFALSAVSVGHTQGSTPGVLGFTFAGGQVLGGLDLGTRNLDNGLNAYNARQLGQLSGLRVADGNGNTVPDLVVVVGDLSVDAGVLDGLGELVLLGFNRGRATTVGYRRRRQGY